MKPTPPGQAEIPEDLPPGQIPVAAFSRRKTAEEHALVVLSMKLPYWLYPHAGRFLLCVPEAQAEAVSEQLEKYRAERRGWPPRLLSGSSGAPPNHWAIGVYVLLLSAFFYGQQRMPWLKEAGVMDTLAFWNDGEWWRPITALTLHADIGHLAGNLLSGICFGLLLTHRFGYGLGWLLLLLSGIVGNVITTLAYYPNQHLALGASTALFGGLGLLVGAAIQTVFAGHQSGAWKLSLLPLAAGVTVLGLTGLGDERTDLLGHVFGFGCGLVIGLLVCFGLGSRLPGLRWQRIFATATLVVLASAWVVA